MNHASGMQLDQYTGIAAILRFPLLTENEIEIQSNINNTNTNTKNATNISGNIGSTSGSRTSTSDQEAILDMELDDMMSFF